MLTVLPHQTVTGKRFGPAVTTASSVTPGAQTSVTSVGSRMAASPNDLARLEEGKRTRQAYKWITDDKLQTATPTGGVADWLLIDNMWFEVAVLLSWQNGVMPHYEYVVVKIENPQDLQ